MYLQSETHRVGRILRVQRDRSRYNGLRLPGTAARTLEPRVRLTTVSKWQTGRQMNPAEIKSGLYVELAVPVLVPQKVAALAGCADITLQFRHRHNG